MGRHPIVKTWDEALRAQFKKQPEGMRQTSINALRIGQALAFVRLKLQALERRIKNAETRAIARQETNPNLPLLKEKEKAKALYSLKKPENRALGYVYASPTYRLQPKHEFLRDWALVALDGNSFVDHPPWNVVYMEGMQLTK